MKNKIIVFQVFLLLTVFPFWACRRNDVSPADNVHRFQGTMTVDGRERTYLLNLPPDYDTRQDFSLVIAMHGGGGSALQFESSSKLTDKASAASFVVVYPEGVASTGLLKVRTWNAGACCAFARDNQIDDVNFIRQLIDKLVAGYKINPRRVYATGHSNGGMMAYRLACELSDKIAAIAPNGCTMVMQTCSPSRPVPILHMHSELDTKVPYQGGTGSGIGTSGIDLPAIDSVLTAWSAKNSCTTTTRVLGNNGDYTFTKWSDCRNGVSLQYYLTRDGGHAWPGGLAGSSIGDTPSAAINANDLLWDFFRQYQLP